MTNHYKRPPVTEAVIEVRFISNLNDAKLEKLCDKQKKKFNIERLEESGVEVSSYGTVTPLGTKFIGFKLTQNDDPANVIQIHPNLLSVSRLAPYMGWEKLLENFKKYYNLFPLKGYKQLSRVGIRFINRIDIPMDGKNKVKEYVKVFPHMPTPNFPEPSHYFLQTVSQIDEDHTLTVSSFRHNDTILINHLSAILDLDIAQIKNLPVSVEKLYSKLDELRAQKNNFFEQLITDKCRELFNYD